MDDEIPFAPEMRWWGQHLRHGRGGRSGREQQRELLTASNAWDRALRRDECAHGATAAGAAGSTPGGDGKTWVMWAGCRSGQHWSHAKKRLAFRTVTHVGTTKAACDCITYQQRSRPQLSERSGDPEEDGSVGRDLGAPRLDWF